MARDLDRPQWAGQRPWFEIWFAVVVDAGQRRALWLRQSLFVPRTGEQPRLTTWGAWFDADATQRTRAAKRLAPVPANFGEGDELVKSDESMIARDRAVGGVPGIAWDVAWTGGREQADEVPSWLPAPTHAHSLASDADASGHVTIDRSSAAPFSDAARAGHAGPFDGERIAINGRATVMHLWGKRRLPTLHWIWAPWIVEGEGEAPRAGKQRAPTAPPLVSPMRALEMQAASLRDRFAMGFASLRIDLLNAPGLEGEGAIRGRPATAAHPSCLVTSTVAGARRLVHARAWAEPEEMVGYAYRDTDGRDLMVAQSDIGSAHYEVYTRTAPGAPWHPREEGRAAGGVAVEIHQREVLPGVSYIGWNETERSPVAATAAPLPDTIEWPNVNAIVALGLTYSDHVRETGQKLDPTAPPTSFSKHPRTVAPGASRVHVPAGAELLAALDELEPGIAANLRQHFARIPAVMDYEGEVALVALGDIDIDALAAGTAQPFGLAAANDLTSRFVQALGEQTDRPLDFWACAKSFPGFLPLAPRVWAPPGGIARMPDLTLTTRVNGEVRQQATTKLLVYDLAAIARAAAAHLGRSLSRGDVILTGTPAGVGFRLSPITRRVAAFVKDRFRRAELLVSHFATSTALLRPGDAIEVDAGPAGTARVRLSV
ncbi:MAG TPA: fumarylacetoacetate hydrolase family protein [Kofleriaceae bacterium]|jgi:2-keto-4-pentenoate hydratase/2-oxohepta-3-ene-1,7-dioic acid hydratase in catechol pathway